jgi:flagellar hook-basal body complex protein FliE
MSTKIDLLVRSLPEFRQPGIGQPGIGGLDTGARAIPLTGGPADGPSFGDTLAEAINGISEVRDHAGDLTRRFAAGEDIELHQLMAAQEEAGIALDLLVELRNKVVESYRTLINMQS